MDSIYEKYASEIVNKKSTEKEQKGYLLDLGGKDDSTELCGDSDSSRLDVESNY